MTKRNTQSSLPPQRKRRAWLILLLVAAVPALFISAGAFGYRVNLTASEPLGIWRIHPIERSARVGDLVFVCPPQTARMVEALDRGYLRAGLCPGAFAPLIKMVAAVAGQTIEIDREVRIDGLSLPQSQLALRDARGRRLAAFEGGSIPAGQVFLYSGFEGSFDSRYFGPVPVSGVLGLASEVLTYAP